MTGDEYIRSRTMRDLASARAEISRALLLRDDRERERALATAIGYLGGVATDLERSAPRLEARPRKAIAVDHERGEIFFEEDPWIDDEERDDKIAFVRAVAAIAVDIFERGARDFRSARSRGDLIAYVEESLTEGLTW